MYAPVAGDSQSPTLYTALQTSDSEAESSGSFDTEGGSNSSWGGGGPGKGPLIPQRWRVVLAIGGHHFHLLLQHIHFMEVAVNKLNVICSPKASSPKLASSNVLSRFGICPVQHGQGEYECGSPAHEQGEPNQDRLNLLICLPQYRASDLTCLMPPLPLAGSGVELSRARRSELSLLLCAPNLRLPIASAWWH